MPRTASSRATPGKMATQGAVARKVWPSASMAPQEIVGDWAPEAEEREAGLGHHVAADADGGGHEERAHRVRQEVAEHEGRRWPAPSARAACTYSRLLSERTVAPHHARDGGPAEGDEHDEHLVEPRRLEDGDEPDGEDEGREGHHDVGGAHQQRRRAGRHRSRRAGPIAPPRRPPRSPRPTPTRERDAASGEHARQEIAAERVGAEGVRAAGRLAAWRSLSAAGHVGADRTARAAAPAARRGREERPRARRRW